MSTIYRITNKINNKAYIGQTTNNIYHRWYHHCYDAVKLNVNFAFYNAIRKYGTECWHIEILENVEDVNMLNEREIYWIAHYNTFKNGYNSSSGGNQKTIYSEETRKKHSEWMLNNSPLKGKKHSKELKIKRSKALKGIIKNKEWIRKISESNKGNVRSTESKLKQSETRIRKNIKPTKKWRENMSKLFSGEGNPAYGRIWLNNAMENKYVYKDEINLWLEKGFELGMKKKNM